ncbi:DUF2235 domain-containing protein [Phanerochaete sordida]|uniref:DUF2235 domain-containing protein n=1 Tax=Phanerochaete sordida TaxID=48140 RepID=A0A9P3LMF7_9APHY|nr:DUF2235 domain-containing protein [Phanerochaete sordida]
MVTLRLPPARAGPYRKISDRSSRPAARYLSTKTTGRTLVLCFDGTASAFDSDNTNVVHFFKLLRRDTDEQLCYYQPGIGTYMKPGAVSQLLRWGAKVLDVATAWYLYEHVHGGYKFLMENYQAGDRICLFGFSRGAYTARALAGMLHKIGLLCKGNDEQVPFAYELYENADMESKQIAQGFKDTFCTPVSVDFVGVWDTVASVGLIRHKTLPFATSNDNIRVFRHALALDERRVSFRPDKCRVCSQVEESKSAAKPAGGTPNTNALEVWFAGCHGDVGGGALPDTERHSLANISLQWMVGEVIVAQCGVLFDTGRLNEIGVKITLVGNDIAVEDRDVCADMHDALEAPSALFWKLLERVWLPHKHTNAWTPTFDRPHHGRGRTIQSANPNFHSSVKRRMELLGYTPSATWEGSPRYVD